MISDLEAQFSVTSFLANFKQMIYFWRQYFKFSKIVYSVLGTKSKALALIIPDKFITVLFSDVNIGTGNVKDRLSLVLFISHYYMKYVINIMFS